jgi:hypothetical protein
VSFISPSGVRHSVDVSAESVYEAAAFGPSRLRRDEWADQIAPGTPIEITVREPLSNLVHLRHDEERTSCDSQANSSLHVTSQ